jgi:excisionase family DNA binding protein
MNGHTPTPERITTAEAARRLGISVATVRRRTAAGELPAEQEQRPQGSKWWVLWEPDAPLTDRAVVNRESSDTLALAYQQIADLKQERDHWRRLFESERAERAEERGQWLAALQASAPPARLTEALHDSAHERGSDASSLSETTNQRSAQQAPGDDRTSLHRMAHELEKKRPWWWLWD